MCLCLCVFIFVFVFVCLCVYLSFCKSSVVAMGIENACAYAGEEPFLILPSRLFLSPFFSPSPSYMVSSYLNRLARKFLPSNTCVCRFQFSYI